MGTPDSPTKLDRRFYCSFLPNAESRRYEQRWRIIGMVGTQVVMAVHILPDLDNGDRRRDLTHHFCTQGHKT